MSLSIPFVSSRQRRRRAVAALVRVDGQRVWAELEEQPPVGSTLDVGFPVIVTESRQVAGGGLLIAAERVDEEVVEARSESMGSGHARVA